jgi:alpha-N-arabinofuranosidase
MGNDKLPAVSGSASRDSLGVTHISLVNIDARNSQKVSVTIHGAKYKQIQGRILASQKLQDHNTFGEPEKIKPAAFKGASLKNNILEINLPPFSVIVVELK